MDQLKHLIEVWTGYAQGLTGSIGALAFVCALACILITQCTVLVSQGDGRARRSRDLRPNF